MRYIVTLDNQIVDIIESDIKPILTSAFTVEEADIKYLNARIGMVYDDVTDSYVESEIDYVEVEPEVVPEPDKLEQVLTQLEEQKSQNLILLNVNMTLYEELLNMQETLTEERNKTLSILDVNMTVYEEILNLKDRLDNA